MLLLPLATQRLDEHHGIVMDWARRGLEFRYLESPLEPSVARFGLMDVEKTTGINMAHR
jgi:hypothetical protein